MGFFGKKKAEEEKQERKRNLVFCMPLFKGEEGYSLEALIEDLKNYWKLNVTDVDGNNETATFNVDGELVGLGFMPAPVPSQELEELCPYSYLWPNAETEVFCLLWVKTHPCLISTLC